MPGFNGTGPEGRGPRTGRGEGNCGTNNETVLENKSTVENKEVIFGIGRGGRPRGGGRGNCYGGGRRGRGLQNRGGRNGRRFDEANQ